MPSEHGQPGRQVTLRSLLFAVTMICLAVGIARIGSQATGFELPLYAVSALLIGFAVGVLFGNPTLGAAAVFFLGLMLLTAFVVVASRYR